jgi:hypothetical protein
MPMCARLESIGRKRPNELGYLCPRLSPSCLQIFKGVFNSRSRSQVKMTGVTIST